eukprot:1433402-Lingulodinium_polyedra.AAC.1
MATEFSRSSSVPFSASMSTTCPQPACPQAVLNLPAQARMTVVCNQTVQPACPQRACLQPVLNLPA